MKPSEIALHAKDIILDRGWIQGRYESDDGVCLHGAIAIAQGDLSKMEIQPELSASLFAVTGILSAVWFNDHPHQTKQEVLDVLDETARRLKEQGL